jgi:peptidoglycan/LPS O-acetylase OafA/YrhL
MSMPAKKYFTNASRRNIVIPLLRLEGALVLSLGLFLIYETFVVDSFEFLPFFGVLLFTLIGGTGLFAAAYAYQRERRFGRAPAVLANLIALGVAKYQFDGGLWYVALPLALLAVVTLYCALTIISTISEAENN